MRTMIKNMNLENLPKRGNVFDWKNSIGYKVHFIYDDIEGDIEIVDYERNKKYYITVKYNNKEWDIATMSFTSGFIGKIVDKVTGDFKIEIGTIFKDDKRDITIIGREVRKKTYIKKDGSENRCNQKWYKYHCNVCDWDEGWIIEKHLEVGIGCSCCANRTPVLGINTIYDTDKWMIPYIGEECAKTHTHSSGDDIKVTCADCGKEKDKLISIATIYYYKSIGCNCGDSTSYGEKIVFLLLKQLEINFVTQLNKSELKWCNKYKYDFYFNLDGEDYICEVNGLQHYENKFNTLGGRSLKEEQLNDRIKKQLALSNGIKEKNYIVIDCRKSNLDWIKNNENGILNSRLVELFDLSKIDWNKCNQYACSNLVKVACEYKNNNSKLTTTEIGQLMGYHRMTITRWLKQGSGIWCNYNVKEERIKTASKSGKASGKSVEIFKDKVSLGIFPSAMELERQSEELFGVKLGNSAISSVCRNNYKMYKGYTFKYAENLKEVANF